MTFRNPELQRLLYSLKEASRNPTHDEPADAVQIPDLSFQSVARDLSDAPTQGSNPSSQVLVSHSVGSRDGHVPASSAHSSHLKVHKIASSLGPPVEDRSRSATPSAQAVPDSSSITSWPAAVKHVTKYIVNDDNTTTRIKHLIQEQHKHEEQWWIQREAIITRHNGRADSNVKVADILKELGGLAMPIVKVDQAAEKNELDIFDKKVYKSLVRMTADFDGQLRKLGIPFYAIKHDLVISDNGAGSDLVISDNGAGSDLLRKGRLDRGELRELQRRMLQYLEDLLMED